MKKIQLINLALLVGLAVALSLWSFQRFSGASSSLSEGLQLYGDMDVQGEVNAQQLSQLQVNGRDSVVLMPGSRAVVDYDEGTGHVDLQLQEGAALFATLANDLSVSVSSSFARLDSQQSIAYVTLVENEMRVYSVSHPSLLTFVLEGEDLNALAVPSSQRVSVSESEVTENLAKLRLTKLTKEFPVFPITEGELDESVESELLAIDESYTHSALSYIGMIQSESQFGPPQKGLASGISSFFSLFRGALTVLPHADDRLSQTVQDEQLLYAMSHLLFGEPSEGEQWLASWEQNPHELNEVEALYADLFFVLPGDVLYPVKSAVQSVVLDVDPKSALRNEYNAIERLLGNGALVEAKQAYDSYKENMELALDAGFFDEDLAFLSREYVLLELLLRQHAIFYTLPDVELLERMELSILNLAGSDQDLDEERQAFVQSKIRFLDNLIEHVIAQLVTASDATELANHLLLSAENYLSSLSSSTAVTDYFESELDGFDLSIQYMNSPEFGTYASFEEGLEAFEEKEEDLEELNDYLQEIRSGEANPSDSSIPLVDAIFDVGVDLTRNEVQYTDIQSLGDPENRLFEIRGARTAGYSLEVNYDRVNQVFYDLVVEDELRFATGIRLESLGGVVLAAMTEPTEAEVVTELEDIPFPDDASLTEDVALAHVANQFIDLGIDPAEITILIVDLDENLFAFEGTFTNEDLYVTANYDSDSERVSEIVWEFNGTPQTLPDTELAQMEVALEATYQALSVVKDDEVSEE